eukprot:16257-Heterococcus_DN1.PRE.6
MRNATYLSILGTVRRHVPQAHHSKYGHSGLSMLSTYSSCAPAAVGAQRAAALTYGAVTVASSSSNCAAYQSSTWYSRHNARQHKPDPASFPADQGVITHLGMRAHNINAQCDC